MKKKERFDHVFRRLLQAGDGLIAGSNSIREHLIRFRRHAYRFASALSELQTEYHAELVAQVKSTGMKLDEWLDQYFNPIEQMGDNRKRLLEAVREGMTEEEYIKQGRIWRIRKKIACPTEAAVPPEAAREPLTRMSPEERLTYLTHRCEALQSAVQALRRDNRELRESLNAALAENARLLKQIEKVDRVLHARRNGKRAVA